MYKCPKCGNTDIFRRDTVISEIIKGNGKILYYDLCDHTKIKIKCDKCDYEGSEDEFKGVTMLKN